MLPNQIQLPKFEFSTWEKVIHISGWVGGSVIINLPFLALTVGPFYGEDYSLLIPSLYGTLLNALLFYKITLTISVHFKEFSKRHVLELVKWFLIISMLESLGDVTYWLITQSKISNTVLEEILLGNPLMNLFLFALPALIYGTVRGWKNMKKGPLRIEIRDGHESVFLDPLEVFFIESDGNYSKFHTAQGIVLERVSLSELLQRLPDNFQRCHKSFIVNIDLISKKSASSIEINGMPVPVGRAFKRELFEKQSRIHQKLI